MNREEFKEKTIEVRGKVEDGLVKAYNWTQKHPIATSIGGTLWRLIGMEPNVIRRLGRENGSGLLYTTTTILALVGFLERLFKK